MTLRTLPMALRQRLHTVGLWVGMAAIVAGCATPPSSTPHPEPAPAPELEAHAPEPVSPAAMAAPDLPIRGTSVANNPREYRREAAVHLYAQNNKRIYLGKLPPLLYAVGVIEADINAQGYVTHVRWLRAPTQAPEVMSEIERMIREASPYPAPVNVGKLTYTDTWLWHKSGRFQLDTLTEGQL
jgi:periplasmic protein TonB